MADLLEVLGGERRIVIARELTKLFESIHRCTLAEAGAWLTGDPNRTRGEFVLIVEGAQTRERRENAEARHTLEILLEAVPLKQAVSIASRLGGGSRNELYKLALDVKKTRATGSTT